MISVALIEDDADYRAGIERLLTDSRRYVVEGSFARAEEAVLAIPRRRPAVVLCDISLPGLQGPAAVWRLREACPQLRCLMLTMSDNADDLFASLQAGAVGYLLKSEAPEEIISGLDEVMAGGAPMSRPIARRVLAAFAKPVARRDALGELTARESEIMDFLARGLAYKEIAAALSISTATVKNHLYHSYEKLAVRSGTEAVAKWLGH